MSDQSGNWSTVETHTFPSVTKWPPSTSGSSFCVTTPIDSSVTDDIRANDISSSANYVYSFFAALGFTAGCFVLYSFFQTYRAHRQLAWLDRLLWAFCGLQLLMLLLSLNAVVHRPDYLPTTFLGCATLSFVINTVSLCGLFVLVLMAYVLTLDPPSNALLRRPGVCATLVILSSVVISLLLAGFYQSGNDMHEYCNCFMDPIRDGVSYAATKLCLVLLIPYTLQVLLLIGGCIRQSRSEGRFLSGSEEGPMFLTVTTVMFLCMLFYIAMLLRAQLLEWSSYEQAFLSVAEFVLFSGSSASLLLVLVMHRPCRESLQGAFRQLGDCCQSPGRTQPNRNIIAPHIEITDTLQDIES